MLTDSLTNDDIASTSLPAEVNDDSCTVKYIEIVPLTSNTDRPCAAKCDSRDWSDGVKQESLPVIKLESGDVSTYIHKGDVYYQFTICGKPCMYETIPRGWHSVVVSPLV